MATKHLNATRKIMILKAFTLGFLLLGMNSPALLAQRRGGFVDQEYIFALSAANRFLSAWLYQDTTEGLALMSRSLRASYSTNELRTYLIGFSNPSHGAFEVGRGNRLRDGRFSFDVILYEVQWGKRIKSRRRRPNVSKIVMVQIGSVWLVDQLPSTSSS